ncbi:MAG: hypothetical protein KIH01_05420, partial [Candidatus Freyarchaeota archaeon]|nr:hypothetical protein [Candidatus Jordarchaeia archaeon]
LYRSIRVAEMSNDELEMIRSRKLLEMMKTAAKKPAVKQRKSERDELKGEKERLFAAVLTADAKRYLDKLRSGKPTVAEKIENAIIYIFANRLMNRKLTEIDIMKMERKVEGVEPKIMIKRRGEDKSLDLAEAIKKD